MGTTSTCQKFQPFSHHILFVSYKNVFIFYSIVIRITLCVYIRLFYNIRPIHSRVGTLWGRQTPLFMFNSRVYYIIYMEYLHTIRHHQKIFIHKTCIIVNIIIFFKVINWVVLFLNFHPRRMRFIRIKYYPTDYNAYFSVSNTADCCCYMRKLE